MKKRSPDQLPFFTRLSSKVAYLAILLVTITALVVALLQYQRQRSEWVAHESERMQNDLMRGGEFINHVVESSSRQVLALAQSPAVTEIMAASRTLENLETNTANTRTAAEHAAARSRAQARLALAKTELNKLFVTLGNSDPELLQIRLITASRNGQELVRVDNIAGTARPILEAALQQKGGRAYVDDTLKTPSGTVSFFGVDLNREQGKIELPIRPVLRTTTPLYYRDGTSFGLIVINLNMRRIFHHAGDFRDNTHQYFLMNERGDYLVHPDSAKIFGFDFGILHRLQDDFPGTAKIIARETTLPTTLILPSAEGESVMSFARIPFDRAHSHRYFVAAAKSSIRPFLGDDHGGLNEIAQVAAALIAGSAVIAFLAGGFVVRPLRDLTNAARRLSNGATPHELREARKRTDEVGALARSFHDMALRLRIRQETLEHKEANIRAILETSLNPIIQINDRGIIQEVNPSTTTLFGYSREELIGSNVSTLMTDEHRDQHSSYLKEYLTTGKAKIIGAGRNVEARRKDGTIIYVHLAISEIRQRSGRRVFVGVITDLTEHMKLDRMKDDFVSTVSHELRTPLTSIKGALGLLKSSILGELPVQAQSMVTIAFNNCDRLVRLINDILDIEKIEAGKLAFEFQSVEVEPFLTRMIEANTTYAGDLGTTLKLGEVPADLHVEADPDRLAQVMANLLSNAVKFSPKDGCVCVAAEKTGDRVRISVRDEGPGIPEVFRDQIFEKFSQADSSDTRQQGGSGLGLAITKEIVQAHGGSIDFDTESGVGTTFYVDLPLTTGMHDGPKSSSGGRARILVCEGDRDTASLIRLIVRGMGWEAEICATAAEAREHLANGHYAAITIDLALAGDGVKLIRELREAPETCDVPILAISPSEGTDNGDAEIATLHIVDWLEKPINVGQLREAVGRAVMSHHPDSLRILHIEDEDDHRNIIATLVGKEAVIDSARSCAEARDLLAENTYDLVILDLILPDAAGESLLPLIHANGSRSPQVLVFSTCAMSSELSRSVDKMLIKSQTSNEVLKRQIQALLDKTNGQNKKTLPEVS